MNPQAGVVGINPYHPNKEILAKTKIIFHGETGSSKKIKIIIMESYFISNI